MICPQAPGVKWRTSQVTAIPARPPPRITGAAPSSSSGPSREADISAVRISVGWGVRNPDAVRRPCVSDLPPCPGLLRWSPSCVAKLPGRQTPPLRQFEPMHLGRLPKGRQCRENKPSEKIALRFRQRASWGQQNKIGHPMKDALGRKMQWPATRSAALRRPATTGRS